MRITLFGKLLSVWPKFTFKCRKFDKCGKWCMVVGYLNRVWLLVHIKEIKKVISKKKQVGVLTFRGGGGNVRGFRELPLPTNSRPHKHLTKHGNALKHLPTKKVPTKPAKFDNPGTLAPKNKIDFPSKAFVIL